MTTLDAWASRPSAIVARGAILACFGGLQAYIAKSYHISVGYWTGDFSLTGPGAV